MARFGWVSGLFAWLAKRSENGLTIYGAGGQTDVTTYSTNGNGYVDLSQVAQHPDARFDVDSGAAAAGHMYMDPLEASAMFNAVTDYHNLMGGDNIYITSAGDAQGTIFPPHQDTHNLGRNFDYRYQNAFGENLVGGNYGGNSAAAADPVRARYFIQILNQYGLDQNYIGSDQNLNGVPATMRNTGHNDHGHGGRSMSTYNNLRQ